MIKICFVCLGNICRSPMAEFIMKHLVLESNLKNSFIIESRATSFEEIGNYIYPPAREKLFEKSIPFDINKRASHLEKEDYQRYDFIIGMDKTNIRSIKHIVNDTEGKVYRLLDFTDNPRDISDPWYTGNFEQAYQDILEGCSSFLSFLSKKLSN